MKNRMIAITMPMLLLCICFAGYAEEPAMRASERIVSCSCGMGNLHPADRMRQGEQP